MTTDGADTVLDLRCKCARCEASTAETYQLAASCRICGWSGIVTLRKGDKPHPATTCPNCGNVFVMIFGYDPNLARSKWEDRNEG